MGLIAVLAYRYSKCFILRHILKSGWVIYCSLWEQLSSVISKVRLLGTVGRTPKWSLYDAPPAGDPVAVWPDLVRWYWPHYPVTLRCSEVPLFPGLTCTVSPRARGSCPTPPTCYCCCCCYPPPPSPLPRGNHPTPVPHPCKPRGLQASMHGRVCMGNVFWHLHMQWIQQPESDLCREHLAGG